jgi:methyltransferase (TIGR00027 family)
MIAWQDDYRDRMNPELVTKLLRASVPVLEFTQWSTLETRPGYAKTVLPISFRSSNQHGVHQAALIGLSADYTAGTALSTIIRGTPVVGVHPQKDDEGASLWSVSLAVNYKSPSSANLVAITEIEPEKQARIARRYYQGNTVLERVQVSLRNGQQEVATAELTFFMRKSNMIRPSSSGARLHPLFEHKLKASARLIAALRARATADPTPIISDPYARQAAGEHGDLLADRFLASSPQLGPMIAARTRHIDDLIGGHGGLKQIVLLGAGFDFRPYRLGVGPDVTVFEVDFPEMLIQRERTIAELGLKGDFTRYSVACDMELDDLTKSLLDYGFNPSLPTVFIKEGTSMYLDAGTNARTLDAIAGLMKNPQSRMWVDYVQNDLFEARHSEPTVNAFLDSMERMGEPFIFGVRSSQEWLQQFGLSVEEDIDTGKYFPELTAKPVYPLYRFAVARAAS